MDLQPGRLVHVTVHLILVHYMCSSYVFIMVTFTLGVHYVFIVTSTLGAGCVTLCHPVSPKAGRATHPISTR